MGLGVIDTSLIVAGQAAGLIEPGEGALDDPALPHELEARGILAAADDLQMQLAKGTQPFDPCDQGTGRATVGPDDLQPAKEKGEAREQG